MQHAVQPKLVYVCSPLNGDVELNVQYATRLCSNVLEAGHYPICSHALTYKSIEVVDEEYAYDYAIKLLSMCDYLYAPLPIVTKGMKVEIDYARKHGIMVIRELSSPSIHQTDMRMATEQLNYDLGYEDIVEAQRPLVVQQQQKAQQQEEQQQPKTMEQVITFDNTIRTDVYTSDFDVKYLYNNNVAYRDLFNSYDRLLYTFTRTVIGTVKGAFTTESPIMKMTYNLNLEWDLVLLHVLHKKSWTKEGLIFSERQVFAKLRAKYPNIELEDECSSTD